MAHDQTNRFKIMRVQECAEAETLEAAQLAASTLLEEGEAELMLVLEQESPRAYAQLVFAGPIVTYRAGIFERGGVMILDPSRTALTLDELIDRLTDPDPDPRD